MNGRAWKKWYKTKPKPCKDDIRAVKSQLEWMKPVDRALKFAKKALREIKKADPDSECGLWYDVNDSLGYRELCRAGGYCNGDQDSGCPYRNLRIAIKGLGGECE